MSLETLLEAARYVEQQEQRAKQFQHLNHVQHHQTINNNHQIPRSASFKIVSSIPTISPVSHSQIAQSTTTTFPTNLITVQKVSTIVQQQQQQPSQRQSLVSTNSVPNGNAIQQQQQRQIEQQVVQNAPSVVLSAPPTGVVEVIQKTSPPTITVQPQQIQNLTNGFDKATALLLEENHPNHSINQNGSQSVDLKKRNHNPCVMRSGTREVHNKLEKNRRAHLKECFEMLKKQLPPQQDEKKSSNLSILHSALRHIQGLKKKERENEHEMERLAREKIAAQQRLAALKKELGPQWDNIDFSTVIQPPEPPLLAIATTNGSTITSVSSSMVASIFTSPDIISPPANPIKEELYDSDEPKTINLNNASVTSLTTPTTTTTLQPTQLSVPVLPIPQVGYPVSQGLVLGVQKVALVSSKNLPLVSSPITHIIPQLNGKVVPLVNAQYLMKPVVVVSTPNAGNATISPRPS